MFGYLIKRLDGHKSRDREREAMKGRHLIERTSVGRELQIGKELYG